jgi:hypothetical protein
MRSKFDHKISNKGNNKITEHRAIFQRESKNSYINKQTKSVNNRKTVKTAMALIEGQIIQLLKEKGQTVMYKTLHKKLQI